MAKQYTERDLGILVAGDWGLVNSVGVEAKPGVGVMATQREQPGPWNYPREMVLNFPFTLSQFREFCDWHTYFQWEVIEARYLNDDGSLDEDALAELARRGEDAAELVRRYLTGETDSEKEAGPPPTLDRAEAREAPPTGQQAETACTAPGDAEQPKAKLHRRTWLEVSSDYIVEVMRAGQHGTAKSLYLDLERKAGPESPFDRGTGDNRGSLFVREIAQSLSLKTVQNEWGRLRELLQQMKP